MPRGTLGPVFLFLGASGIPGGYFHIRRSGGLGPGIEFRGKIWGTVQSSSPNNRKNLESSVTTRHKNWERITILGAFRVISEIQRAKFGVSVTYIFGGKIWGSDMNFRGKIWSQSPPPPPDLHIWNYPLWVWNTEYKFSFRKVNVYTDIRP